MDKEKKPDSTGVASIERAFLIIDSVLQSKQGELTLKEISESTGLYKSTILRIAETLTKHRYLERDRNGRFRIGVKALTVGNAYKLNDKVTIINEILTELRNETSEGVQIQKLVGEYRVCVMRVESEHTVRFVVKEGDLFPIDKGASGRVLNAFSGAPGSDFDIIRRDMYYVSVGERDVTLAGIAAPIFEATGLFGALAVGGPRSRLDRTRLEALRKPLLNAAIRVSSVLGGDVELLQNAFRRLADS